MPREQRCRQPKWGSHWTQFLHTIASWPVGHQVVNGIFQRRDNLMPPWESIFIAYKHWFWWGIGLRPLLQGEISLWKFHVSENTPMQASLQLHLSHVFYFFFYDCEYVQEVAKSLADGAKAQLCWPNIYQRGNVWKKLTSVQDIKIFRSLSTSLRMCVYVGGLGHRSHKAGALSDTWVLRHHYLCSWLLHNRVCWWARSILTWHRGHRDHEGGSPRARRFHCTSIGLTLAIPPNVGDSGG